MTTLDYTATFMLDRAQNPTMISCEEAERLLATEAWELVSLQHREEEGELVITRHGEPEQVVERCHGASAVTLAGFIRKAVPKLSSFTCRQIATVLDGLNAAVSLMWRAGEYDPRPVETRPHAGI